MGRLVETAKQYWKDPEVNIFRNCNDALLGLIVLLVLPFVSLITICVSKSTGWSAYCFPLISICMAGIYDAYGRYRNSSPINIKLCVRVIFDILAAFTAVAFASSKTIYILLISPILLVFSGLLILGEVILRVQIAVQLSKWYSNI